MKHAIYIYIFEVYAVHCFPQFSLQETLQHEARLVDSLYRLGVQSTDLQATLSLKVHSDQQSFVVDMRSDSVVVSE